MKKTAVVFTTLMFLSVQGMAWGALGHQIIAKVAERYLTPKAAARIQEVGGFTLPEVSMWMDQVRGKRMYSKMNTWHYVVIENGESYHTSPKNFRGDVIGILQSAIADPVTFGGYNEYSSEFMTRDNALEYTLRIVVHLMGDLHQPLHISRASDKGGNLTPVVFGRAHTNLHEVWDNGMLRRYRLSYEQFAEKLYPATDNLFKMKEDIDIAKWGQESMTYRSQVYAIGDGVLGQEYCDKNKAALESRIMLAGIRLARVLNFIFDN